MTLRGRIVALVAACLIVAAMAVVGARRVRNSDQPHSVTLNWKAPASRQGVIIVGYNVYRRTEESSPPIKIADRVPAPPYEDRLVTSGRVYVYTVTTVDQSGRESRFSEPATAKIP